MADYERISKFLSLILRHKPQAIGIELDSKGWASVPELLEGLERNGFRIDMATLERIVATNDKKRYALSEDKTKIRANQGHSLNVDVGLKAVVPPTTLYHGTADRFYDSIMQSGLQKQSRNHVHMNTNAEAASKVGERYGNPIVLKIDAKAMYEDGHKFFMSANGVWLTNAVPVNYISAEKIIIRPTMIEKDGKSL